MTPGCHVGRALGGSIPHGRRVPTAGRVEPRDRIDGPKSLERLVNECHRITPGERPTSDHGADHHRDQDVQPDGDVNAAERGESVETFYPAEGNHRVLPGHGSDHGTDERRRSWRPPSGASCSLASRRGYARRQPLRFRVWPIDVARIPTASGFPTTVARSMFEAEVGTFDSVSTVLPAAAMARMSMIRGSAAERTEPDPDTSGVSGLRCDTRIVVAPMATADRHGFPLDPRAPRNPRRDVVDDRDRFT